MRSIRETASANQAAWDSLLAKEQLRLLHKGLPTSFIANIFLASLLLFVQWPVIDHGVLYLWYFMLLFVLLLRIGLYFFNKRRQPTTDDETATALLGFRVTVFMTGLAWGATGIWLFPQNNLPHQFFVAFVLAGLSAGAITSLAMDKLSALLLVVPAILPITLHFLIETTRVGYAMAAMVCFFMLYVLMSAARLQKDLHEGVRLRSTLEKTFELLERSNAAALIGTWDVDVAKQQTQWSAITKKIHEVPDDFCCSVEAGIAFYKEGESRDTIKRVFLRAQEQGVAFDEELQIITAKGNERWVRAIGTPEFLNGKCVNIYGTFQDINERKRIDTIKSEFISTVSHELRTPLTAISASLAVINAGKLGELATPIAKLIDIAHKNSLRLTHLINDLLDMDKLVAGKMHLDMQEQLLLPLVEQAIVTNQSYADQFNVSLVMQASDPTLRIYVDALRLQQVLANLLSNAIKFSPAHAVVIIAINQYQSRVRIAVIDQGSGIPEAFRARIFQKFSQADSSDTRQKGGTGLGLAITRELVEHMGGDIHFESIEGQGSTFWVEFDAR